MMELFPIIYPSWVLVRGRSYESRLNVGKMPDIALDIHGENKLQKDQKQIQKHQQ